MKNNDSKKHYIPEKIKSYMVPGRSMKNLGEDLVEIKKVDDCYHLRTNMSFLTGRMRNSTETASKILTLHATAALFASQGKEVSNKYVEIHLKQQYKKCSCGKKGFKEFYFGNVSQYGKAFIEYRCVYCGNLDSFVIDHSQ